MERRRRSATSRRCLRGTCATSSQAARRRAAVARAASWRASSDWARSSSSQPVPLLQVDLLQRWHFPHSLEPLLLESDRREIFRHRASVRVCASSLGSARSARGSVTARVDLLARRSVVRRTSRQSSLRSRSATVFSEGVRSRALSSSGRGAAHAARRATRRALPCPLASLAKDPQQRGRAAVLSHLELRAAQALLSQRACTASLVQQRRSGAAQGEEGVRASRKVKMKRRPRALRPVLRRAVGSRRKVIGRQSSASCASAQFTSSGASHVRRESAFDNLRSGRRSVRACARRSEAGNAPFYASFGQVGLSARTNARNRPFARPRRGRRTGSSSSAGQEVGLLSPPLIAPRQSERAKVQSKREPRELDRERDCEPISRAVDRPLCVEN